jgi:hypothetical protein
MEHRIGREGASRFYSLGDKRGHRRRHYRPIFIAEHSGFARMRIDAGNRKSGPC